MSRLASSPVQLLLLVALTTLAGPACEYGPDTGPSQGLCTGAMGSRPLDGVIDAQDSEFHLVGETFLVRLSYLRGGLQATGTAAGVFTASEHADSLTDPFAPGAWAFQEPQSRPGLQEGEVTVEHVTPYRMKGSLRLANDDGSTLCCGFDLRRAVELEQGLGD